jgi:hypothetical protein
MVRTATGRPTQRRPIFRDKLLRDAAEDSDQFFNYALAAVIMAGAGLGGRLTPDTN